MPKPTDIEERKGEPRSQLAQDADQVYGCLIDLMDLLSGFNARDEIHSSTRDENCYFTVAILYQQLLKWYSKLPEKLKWAEENIKGAPSSFFSLQ